MASPWDSRKRTKTQFPQLQNEGKKGTKLTDLQISLNKYLLSFYHVPGTAYALLHGCVRYSEQSKHLWAHRAHLPVGSEKD